MGQSTRNVFNSKGSGPSQPGSVYPDRGPLLLLRGRFCQDGQRGKGCCHFQGGRDSLSLAHPVKLRKGLWWAGGSRTQTAAFEELARIICLAQPPCCSLLLDHCFQEAVSQAWGREGKSVLSLERTPSPQGGRKDEHLQGRASQQLSIC